MKFKKAYLFGSMGYILWLVYSLVMTFNSTGDNVAFWGLSEKTTSAVILLIWPIAITAIFMFLSLKIFAPLFLKSKIKTQKHNSIRYLSQKHNYLAPKVLFGRFFQLFLLSLGLVDALVNMGILIPENFTTQVKLDEWMTAGIDPRYTAVVLGKMVSLIIPIAFGLWTVSWIFEDLGILQFQLPDSKEPSDLYEINPVHKIYSATISGYGGCASLFFYTGYFIYYITDYSSNGGNFADLIMILVIALSVLYVLPIYLLYGKISKDKFIRDMEKAPELTKSILE